MNRQNELVWMAGFFDGEGSITIFKRGKSNKGETYGLMICVGQNDLAPLMLFKNRFGGYLWTAKGGRHHQWRASAQVAKNVLLELLPYLIVKADQARIAISFQERKLSRGKCYDETSRIIAEQLNFEDWRRCHELKAVVGAQIVNGKDQEKEV